MPTYRSGANARLALGKESAYNTASAAMHDIPKSSFTVPGPYERIESDELRSDANPAADAKGLQSGEGWSLDAMVTSETFGLFCYWFFGDYAKSGAGDPYEHVFKIGAALPPSLSAEYGDTQTAISRYDAFYGMYLNSFGLNISKTSELMKLVVGGTSSGKFDLNGSTPLDASPDVYVDPRHVMPAATMTIDAGAVVYVTSIDLMIEREVFPLNPLDGNLFAAAATLGKYKVTATLTGWRDQADVLYGLDDNAEHAVVINSPEPGSATHDIDINFPECYIYATEQTSISGDGPAEFQVSVSAFYADATEASAVEITVSNATPDYAAV